MGYWWATSSPLRSHPHPQCHPHPPHTPASRTHIPPPHTHTTRYISSHLILTLCFRMIHLQTACCGGNSATQEPHAAHTSHRNTMPDLAPRPRRASTQPQRMGTQVSGGKDVSKIRMTTAALEYLMGWHKNPTGAKRVHNVERWQRHRSNTPLGVKDSNTRAAGQPMPWRLPRRRLRTRTSYRVSWPSWKRTGSTSAAERPEGLTHDRSPVGCEGMGV